MKIYVKSIRYKKHRDEANKGECSLPCVACAYKCRGADCADLKNWLCGMDEVSVEWKACHDGLAMMRIVCRTVAWVALIVTTAYVTWKWGR